MRFASTTNSFLPPPSPPFIKDLANALALSPYRLASCAILSKSLNALLFGLFSFALRSASRTVSSYRHQDIPPPLFLPLFSTTPKGYSLEDSTTNKSESSFILCAFLTFFSHFCTRSSISSSFRSTPAISRSKSLHILSEIFETCSNAHKIVSFAEEARLNTVSSSFSSSFAFFFLSLDFSNVVLVRVLRAAGRQTANGIVVVKRSSSLVFMCISP